MDVSESRFPYPIRVFLLEDLGINRGPFVRFATPIFSILHMDPYDAKRNKVEFLRKRFPFQASRLNRFLADYYASRADLGVVRDLVMQLSDEDRRQFDRIGVTARRKRGIAKFQLVRSPAGWDSKRIPASAFRQAVSADDSRSLVRVFHELPSFVTEHRFITRLVDGVRDMVEEAKRPHTVAEMELALHFMLIFADMIGEGENAPEGIHQDGADYIVSALVVERAGIEGGESVVYELDGKTEIFRHTLRVGEGLFQDDRHYRHFVTPICEDPDIPPPFGSRSIIGCDVTIIR